MVERRDHVAVKTSNVYVRVEPEIKEQAESIFAQLGISASAAVNMFYNQVVLQQGIPFPVTTVRRSASVQEMTKDVFDQEMQKGFDAMSAGDVKPAEEVFAELRGKYRK